MFFNFKKKKEIKSSDDLLKALGASDVNAIELSFEFNRLLNQPNHNYVSSLDQTNAKLINNSYEYRFEGINQSLQKDYKIKKLKYLLWLKVINKEAIEGFGSRNVNINLGSLSLFPQMTFNLDVKEEISNEIVTQFKKNKKINFLFGLIKYNEENCKLFKHNYFKGDENQNLIILDKETGKEISVPYGSISDAHIVPEYEKLMRNKIVEVN